MKKGILLFILASMTLRIFSQTFHNCPLEKLYGEWIFIDSYKGKLTDIEPLLKETSKSELGLPVMTYNKTGQYINDQVDYKTSGRYILDSLNCLIKEFNDNGIKNDTSLYQIIFLDNNFLLITKLTKDTHSYFYKRK